MLTRNMGVALAGGLGLAFVGYCVYFDQKRRSHPDFKKKLIESNQTHIFVILQNLPFLKRKKKTTKRKRRKKYSKSKFK